MQRRFYTSPGQTAHPPSACSALQPFSDQEPLSLVLSRTLWYSLVLSRPPFALLLPFLRNFILAHSALHRQFIECGKHCRFLRQAANASSTVPGRCTEYGELPGIRAVPPRLHSTLVISKLYNHLLSPNSSRLLSPAISPAHSLPISSILSSGPNSGNSLYCALISSTLTSTILLIMPDLALLVCSLLLSLALSYTLAPTILLLQYFTISSVVFTIAVSSSSLHDCSIFR